MNIPSPAAVKKTVDARKAREVELASQLQSASQTKQLPSTESPSSKRSVKRASATPRSSQKAKGSQDRSSKSYRNKVTGSKDSRPSTSSTLENTASSTARRKDRGSTSTTGKKNFSNGVKQTSTPGAKDAKKPFVRPEHLTQRPLRDNEALQKLRKDLEKPARGQFKRAYRTRAGNEISSKHGRTVKKENS